MVSDRPSGLVTGGGFCGRPNACTVDQYPLLTVCCSGFFECGIDLVISGYVDCAKNAANVSG
jgi:hypothetical protein